MLHLLRLGTLCLQVGALIMLHLTVTWELVFTGRGLNHATPDCDLGACLYR